MIRKFLRLAAIIGSLPNTISNGQTADAVPLMADLNFIVSQVNTNAAPLTNTALLNAANSFTAVQSGLAAASAANFPIASQVQNQSFNTLSSILGTNSISARVAALPLGAYASGQVFSFLPSQPNNAGPVSILIDALGSIAVTKLGVRVLASNELMTSSAMLIRYDSTPNQMQIVGPITRYPREAPQNSSSGVTIGAGSTTLVSLNCGNFAVGDKIMFQLGVNGTKITTAGDVTYSLAKASGSASILFGTSGSSDRLLSQVQINQLILDSMCALAEVTVAGTLTVQITATSAGANITDGSASIKAHKITSW